MGIEDREYFQADRSRRIRSMEPAPQRPLVIAGIELGTKPARAPALGRFGAWVALAAFALGVVVGRLLG